MLQFTRRLPVLISLTAVLAACGGGGGGGGFKDPNISTTPVAITQANVDTVASSAVMAVSAGSSMTDAGSLAGGTLKPGGGSQSTMLSIVMNQVQDGVALAVNSGVQTSPTGITQSQTQQCTGGGSVTISATTSTVINSTADLSAGDSLSLTANNCVEATETTNGSVTFTFVTDPNLAGAEISLVANNFQITDSTGTFTIHGDISLAMDSDLFTFDPSNSTVTISGNSLFFIEAGGDAIKLSSYTITVATTAGVYNIIGSLTVDSTIVGGRLTITMTAVGGSNLDPHPTFGTITVVGANSDTLTITIGATDVSWELDLLGDGSVDATGTTLWSTIQP